MRIESLIRGLGLRHHAGPTDADLTDLTDDSRRVRVGAVFVARGQGPDQESYIAQALDRGAAAVISEPVDPIQPPPGVAWFCHDRVDQRLAGTLAERFFGEPGNKLTMIGVTGTNGKTTTALLIQHLLSCAGVQTGVIGTIHTDDGTPAGKRAATLTTPGAIELSRELARMVDAGCEAAVTEVSSHALDQGRAAALTFHTAVFTNLTQDHLDYHPTMQAYAQAKSTLFAQLSDDGQAVVNLDDPHARQVLGGYAGPVLWTTLADQNPADPGQLCAAEILELRADASLARFVGPWGDAQARLPLVGGHNVCNTLQAIAAAHTVTDISHSLQQVLESIPQVPGRLERVLPPLSKNTPNGFAAEPPAVLVDYAHTPDALHNALSALRPVTPGRLIVMFGCGGDRDKNKRPKMAQAACQHADRCYLTSDNPRTEDPDAIIRDALAGVPANKIDNLTVIPDRAQAIRACVMEGAAGDTVLLAGKGHEDYQTIGHENIHFDDREHATDALWQWSRQKAAP